MLNKKLTKADRALLRKVQHHTHMCAICVGLWTTTKPDGTRREGGPLRFYLNVAELEGILAKPRDRRKFEKHKGMWYHAKCWKWIQRLEKELNNETPEQRAQVDRALTTKMPYGSATPRVLNV